MVDIHSHILPGIDDGADSWDTATQMCLMAAKDGITHMVATPPANEQYPYDRAQFLELLAALQEKGGAVLQLSLGCDFHRSYENLESLFSDPSPYLIGDTRYLLIEL